MTEESRPKQLGYERVAEELREMIVSGELQLGDRLPSEGDLTTHMSVSRGTLREAIRLLSSQKLLTSVRGVAGGTFVAEPAPEDVISYLETSLTLLTRNRVSVESLLEVRGLLEVPASALAAHRRTSIDLRDLEETLSPAVNGAAGPEVWRACSRFHRLILRAADNPLLEMVTQPVFSVMQDRFLRDRAGTQFWEKVLADHAEIFRHIRLGDAAATSAAMSEHLGTNLRDTYVRIDSQSQRA